MDLLQNLMSPNGAGGLLKKKTTANRGLIREGGRVNSEEGFNRDLTVKQQPD